MKKHAGIIHLEDRIWSLYGEQLEVSEHPIMSIENTPDGIRVVCNTINRPVFSKGASVAEDDMQTTYFCNKYDAMTEIRKRCETKIKKLQLEINMLTSKIGAISDVITALKPDYEAK